MFNIFYFDEKSDVIRAQQIAIYLRFIYEGEKKWKVIQRFLPRKYLL